MCVLKRQVPAESGWILDGFPADITQAHLLEEALGGCESIRRNTEASRTNLAALPATPPPPPAPVLNLALLLDIPDETVVQRAYSHTGERFMLCIPEYLIMCQKLCVHLYSPKITKWMLVLFSNLVQRLILLQIQWPLP